MSEDPDDFDEQIEPVSPSDPVRPRHLGDTFRLFAPLGVEVRGENAYAAAVKFFELLSTEVADPDWQKKLLQAWISAVKNRNYSRFAKEFRRWRRSLNPVIPPTGTPSRTESERVQIPSP